MVVESAWQTSQDAPWSGPTTERGRPSGLSCSLKLFRAQQELSFGVQRPPQRRGRIQPGQAMVSRQLQSEQPPSCEGVSHRLANEDPKRRAEKHMERLEARERELAKQTPFAPNLSPSPRRRGLVKDAMSASTSTIGSSVHLESLSSPKERSRTIVRVRPGECDVDTSHSFGLEDARSESDYTVTGSESGMLSTGFGPVLHRSASEDGSLADTVRARKAQMAGGPRRPDSACSSPVGRVGQRGAGALVWKASSEPKPLKGGGGQRPDEAAADLTGSARLTSSMSAVELCRRQREVTERLATPVRRAKTLAYTDEAAQESKPPAKKLDVKAICERLFHRDVRAREERQRQRVQQQQEALARQTPFSPTVRSVRSTPSQTPRAQDLLATSQRLFQDFSVRALRLEKARQKKLEDEMKELKPPNLCRPRQVSKARSPTRQSAEGKVEKVVSARAPISPICRDLPGEVASEHEPDSWPIADGASPSADQSPSIAPAPAPHEVEDLHPALPQEVQELESW